MLGMPQKIPASVPTEPAFSGSRNDEIYQDFLQFEQEFEDEYYRLLSQSTFDLDLAAVYPEEEVKEEFKMMILNNMPIRSGLLVDTILNSFHFEVLRDAGEDKINFYPQYTYIYPSDRPLIISRPQHAGELGYGQKYSPINSIPNRSLIRETAKSALYQLNDPGATANPKATIALKMRQILYDANEKLQQNILNLTRGTDTDAIESEARGNVVLEFTGKRLKTPFMDPAWKPYFSGGNL